MIALCGTPCGLPSLLCLESCRVVWISASLFTTLSFDFLRACQMVDHGLRQALEQSLSQRTILGGPLLKNHPAYRTCNSSSDSRLLKTLKSCQCPKGMSCCHPEPPKRCSAGNDYLNRVSDRHFQAFATSDTNSTRRSAAVCFSPRGPPCVPSCVAAPLHRFTAWPSEIQISKQNSTPWIWDIRNLHNK